MALYSAVVIHGHLEKHGMGNRMGVGSRTGMGNKTGMGNRNEICAKGCMSRDKTNARRDFVLEHLQGSRFCSHSKEH